MLTRRALILCYLLVFTTFASCNSAAPTTVPPGPPTQASTIIAADTPAATDTATTPPTQTATVSPTATATFTATTQVPNGTTTPGTAKAFTNPPSAPASGPGITANVWFMGPTIAYFSKLGAYPPEAPLPRPANVNPLTGLAVADPTLLQRRPILARLGNDPVGARPQTGLNEADLVFEEIIDQRHGVFALTRLTAVYLGQNATVRPFRSARPVNTSLEPMFDGFLAHSGASKDMRFLLSQLPWYPLNIDDLFAGPVYCTIGSDYRSRFVSTVQHIHEYMAAKGRDKAVSLRGFVFSPTPPAAPPIHSLAFDHFPWPISTVGITQWNYDAASGRYLRFANGAPHNTLQYAITPNWASACSVASAVTTQQVSAANVIVLNALYEPTAFIEDTNGFASAMIHLVGSGVARIYRDGVQITGTWTRPTLQHFFQFVDASGNAIPLKPGNTWFEIAPDGYLPTTH